MTTDATTPQRRAADGFTTTEKVVGAWCVLLAAYEVYLICTDQQLITQAMISMSKKYPVITFALGLLMGHFYWAAAAQED